MDSETIFKIVAAVVSVLGTAKVIFELSSGGKAKLREEYRFAKEFFRDLSQEPKLHPLAIEKGYYAIAGTAAIKSKEIEYILSLENPDRCLKDYVLSRKYLEHVDRHESTKIEFSSKYKGKWSRSWRKATHLTIYFVGALAAMSPFLLHQQLGLQAKQSLLALVITVPSFGFFAFESLRSFIKIYRAEKLIQSQNKHSKLIVLERKSA